LVRPADKLCLVRQAAQRTNAAAAEGRRGNRGRASRRRTRLRCAVAVGGECVRCTGGRTNARWPLPIKMRAVGGGPAAAARAVRCGAGAACVRVGDVHSAAAPSGVLELRNFTAAVGH
jgi:hypothetical protein